MYGQTCGGPGIPLEGAALTAQARTARNPSQGGHFEGLKFEELRAPIAHSQNSPSVDRRLESMPPMQPVTHNDLQITVKHLRAAGPLPDQAG